MEAQEQSQILTPIVQKVKTEAVEAYSFNDEDQLTVSQILLTGKNPLDFPLNIVSDNPSRSESSKRGREIVDNFYDHFEAQSRVMARAKEIEASLAPEFPSFWKLMLCFHVTEGFNWLSLPSEFCKLHLPSLDAAVVLEDESGEKYNSKYLADRTGLGGWKGFSSAQKLLEGDAVVFHLVRRINPFKFKVYIVRAKDFEVADAPSLPHSDACAKETGAHAQKTKEKKQPRLEIDYEPRSDWNNMHSSDTTEGSKFSGSMSDIKNLNIVLNGWTINSELLPTHIRTKYYDLCCTKKSYIHEGLLPTIDSKMAVGIISETINIADAIRASNISTSPNDLPIWDKTLEAFGLLGMNVGFLRDRLNRLVSLSSESKEASNRYAEASIERDGVQIEMKSLELKLLGMKQGKSRLDNEMEDLKEKEQKNEFLFQKEAIAPW